MEREKAEAEDMSYNSDASQHSQDSIISQLSQASSIDSDVRVTHTRSLVDDILNKLDQPQINLHTISVDKRNKYIDEIHAVASAKLKEKIKIAVDGIQMETEEEEENNDPSTDDMNRLLEAIKQKLKVPGISINSKVQLLTLVPESWSLRKAHDFFGESIHLLKKARDLRKERGIIATPAKYTRQRIEETTLTAIKIIYEDDEYSRTMPGKKDYVTVNGTQHQKRLILCKLEELYRLFKEKNPAMKVSLSKFSQERPKWCTLVGPKGTHTVCTCIKHENVKLLAANTAFDYKVNYLFVFNQ